MIEIGNSLDGTVEKAISATEKLNGLPKLVQKFALAGDFSLGNAKKIDLSNYASDSKKFENYIALISTLDKKQRDLVVSMTNFKDAATKSEIPKILKELSDGTFLNGSVVEQVLKEKDFSKAAVEGLTAVEGLKDATTGYGLALTSKAIPAMEQWINQHVTSVDITKLQQDNIIAGTAGNYKFSDSFVKVIKEKQKDIEVTKELINEQQVWNGLLQIGKQLLVSFAISAFIAGVQKLIQAWKDYRDRFVNGMNDAHDAAEKAKSDVDGIQAKIDELNEKVKAAGADKISDIVDPAERAKLEAINENLEKQLKLKQQLQEIEEKKEHDNAVEVYNTKDEIVYKDDEGNYDYTMGIAPNTAGFKATAHESLDYYNGMLNKYTKKYNDLLATTADENDPALVSAKEQMDFAADEVTRLSGGLVDLQEHLSDTSDEYAEITAVLGDASDALSYYNGEVVVSTTAYDVLLKKMQATKNLMDRRNRDVSNSNPYTSAVKTLKTSGLETGDDIRELSMVPANQTKEQADAIAVLQKAADDAHVTLDQFISALESVGLIAVRNVNNIKSLSDAMSVLDNMQSAYQSCAAAVKEYNKTGYVSMDTLQSLCQLEPQYLRMLELKNGKLKINTKTAQSLTQANIQLAKASLLADTLNNIKENNNLAKAKSILGDVTAVIKDADTALAAAAQKSQNEAKDSGGWEAYDYTSRANSVLIDNYHTLSELFDTLGKQDPSKIWGKDNTSKSTKQASSAIDAWSTLSSAMEEYNKQGSISLNTMKSLMGLEEKYTACLKKQGNELTIDATKFRDMIQAELKKAAEIADASDKTKAKVAQYNKILKYLDENAKDGTISLNELRDAIEGVGTSLDKAQEKTSGLKSAFGTIHDILNTDNPTGALTSDNVESVIDLIQEHKELKDILFDESGNLQINEESLKKATIALLENEKAATKDAAIKAVLQKSINDLSSGIISITDYLKGLNTELDDVDAKLDKFQSGFSDITDIVDEYNLYGKLTQDSMQKLLRLDPQYLECLEKEGDQLKFNAAQYRLLYAEQVHQFALNAKTNSQRKVYTGILSDIFGFTPEQTEEYESALQGYADTVKEVQDAGLAKYGNVDNINRTRIDWTAENMEKYHDFVAEQNEFEPDSIVEGGYSTVLGASNAFETDDGEKEIAYTPMLQTEDGVVPLTSNEIASYINDVIAKASKLKGGATAENILKIDAEGLFEGVAGEEVEVKNMIAGVEGQIVNDVELTAADIAAIGGETAENLQKYFGESSEWAGKSLHDVQSKIFDSKENVEKLTGVLNSMGIDGAKALQLLKEHFKDANSTAEKFKAALSDIKDVFSSLLSLFEKFNTDKDNDLKIWGDAMGKVIDKRIEALNKQKEALEKANDEEERAITLAKLKAELEKARTQRTVRKLTSNGYEWVADESAVKDAKDNLSDQQRQWRKEDAEKAIDDQIKKYNEFKDKLSEAMDDIGKSWKDYQKELKYTAQIQKMTLSQMEGTLDGYHNKIVASLNTGSAITSIQNLITNLESLINTFTKVNNLYSWAKTGEYKDLGTKGLWNTIKGFFNKGSKEAAAESGKTVETFFEKLSSKVQTSGSGLIDKFKGIWEAIKTGVHDTFNGSGNGIVSTVVKGFKTIGDAVSKSKVGSTLIKGAGKLVAGAGGMAIPIAGAVGLGIYGGVKSLKNQKEIWSNKEDGFGKKAVKSVASFFWDSSPVGMIVNLCKGIFGKNKEIADNTKDNGKDNQSSSSSGTTNSGEGVVIGNIKDKKADGSRSIKQSGRYNVDERGPELLVRQPSSGRYTYLETGDGVVPADITSRLFDMGGNPDRWFTEQMERNAGISNVQNRTVEGDKITVGDIYIQNPVGGVDDLAREINQRMPAMFKQIQSKR